MSAVLDNRSDLDRAANVALLVEKARPLPDELEPVETFPLVSLPDAFRPFVSDVAERMQCVPDFVAVPLLVGAASLVARTLRMRPQGLTDWSETPNLWALIVGSSATMKSPTMREALASLQGLEARAADRHSLEVEDFAGTRSYSGLSRSQTTVQASQPIELGERPEELGFELIDHRLELYGVPKGRKPPQSS